MKTIIGRKLTVINWAAWEYVLRQVYCWLFKVLRSLVALNLFSGGVEELFDKLWRKRTKWLSNKKVWRQQLQKFRLKSSSYQKMCINCCSNWRWNDRKKGDYEATTSRCHQGPSCHMQRSMDNSVLISISTELKYAPLAIPVLVMV